MRWSLAARAGFAALWVSMMSLVGLPCVAAEDVSALLLQKTQVFSDAGQQGDAAVMAKMLDDDVVFFNEGGDQATRKDMVSSASPPAKGVTTRMTVTDWNCRVHANVAVASFIDDQVQDFHGQSFHAKYRSVETWLKEGADWKMIGSETLALSEDPPAVSLPAKALDDYVGDYQAAPDVKFTFTRSGDELLASANGGPATAQKAELRDVFFTPGRARYRKIFQRDASGAVTGFVSRREGHDIVFKRI
jgi:ketosteroid isomerase-like protein